MTPEARLLPVHVRLHHLETPQSYGRRLTFANGIPERIIPANQRKRSIATRRSSDSLKHPHWCESMGGLEPGHFRRQDVRLGAGLLGRSLCRLCAHGEEVDQISHIESNCCLRHHLWTGPGTTVNEQVKVSVDVLVAERRYRYLLKRRRISLPLFTEIATILKDNAATTLRPGVSSVDITTYVSCVQLIDLLTDRNFHRKLFDTRQTFAQAYNFLAEMMRLKLCKVDHKVVDDTWLLLRPTFLWIRQYALAASVGRAFVPPVTVHPADIVGATRSGQPLEPFRRYLDQLRTESDDSMQHRWRLYVVGSQRERPTTGGGGAHLDLLCEAGHAVRRHWNQVVAALNERRRMCPICNGNQALAGYNSLLETHPRLAEEWDTEHNGSLIPSVVTAGCNKKISWTCSEGHRFRTALSNRTFAGTGCPVCTNKTVLPGHNDLATTHPIIARDWHPELNDGLQPNEVIEAGRIKIAWLCFHGHDYWKTIRNRKKGQGCPFCSNRRVLPGENDLATTHPEIAGEWHPDLNGAFLPHQVSAGSEFRAHWLCALGHTYTVEVYHRTGPKKGGCPYCSNRRLLTGFNDLAGRYPALALDFSPDQNNGLTAAEVMPGAYRFWRCKHGHEQHMHFQNRRRAGGCTACPVEERRAAPQPRT
jgi:hypothetical protein